MLLRERLAIAALVLLLLSPLARMTFERPYLDTAITVLFGLGAYIAGFFGALESMSTVSNIEYGPMHKPWVDGFAPTPERVAIERVLERVGLPGKRE